MSNIKNKDNNLDNNINNKDNNINKEEDINSTNNLVDELTFGCSTSSFKRPKTNIINNRNNSKDYKNKNESDISGISEDLQDFKDFKDINNFINTDNKKNIEQNFDTLNTINSIKSINNNSNKENNFITQSLSDLIYGKKNEIISLNSTRKDIASMDSNFINRDNQSINQSLINLIYGNRKKNNKNDIFSNNSNINYNNYNNSFKDNESVNQSLINLIHNRNEIITNKSNGTNIQNEVASLNSMFRHLNNRIKIKEREKKILYSGFVNMFEDNSKQKNIKHVNIIKKNNKNINGYDDDYNLEKLYVYKNKGIINNNEDINKKLAMKKTIDDDKYYFINIYNNDKINTKIHYSKLFSKKRNSSVEF